MSKTLLGYSVDDETFEKYAGKMYQIESYSGNIPTTFNGLVFRAEHKNYVGHESAKKIIEEIKAEIRANGKEQVKTMKHEKFSGYLADVKAIHEKAVQEYTSLQEKFSAAKAEWEIQQKSGADDERWLTYRKAEFLEKEDTYKAGLADLQKRTKESIAAIRADLQEHLSDFYTPDGSRIDDNIVRLLNSGIKLTKDEFNHIIQKNMHNPTMLRVLGEYADEHKIATDEVKTLHFYAQKGGAAELKVFDDLGDVANWSVSEKDSSGYYRAVFDSVYDKSVADMSGMKIQPEAAE